MTPIIILKPVVSRIIHASFSALPTVHAVLLSIFFVTKTGQVGLYGLRKEAIVCLMLTCSEASLTHTEKLKMLIIFACGLYRNETNSIAEFRLAVSSL